MQTTFMFGARDARRPGWTLLVLFVILYAGQGNRLPASIDEESALEVSGIADAPANSANFAELVSQKLSSRTVDVSIADELPDLKEHRAGRTGKLTWISGNSLEFYIDFKTQTGEGPNERFYFNPADLSFDASTQAFRWKADQFPMVLVGVVSPIVTADAVIIAPFDQKLEEQKDMARTCKLVSRSFMARQSR